ncbi:hypothetical protein C8J36_1032 [Rhizobium sp. PP-F2F-G48]|uniref:site-specific integrase n=1 Tax=Rhizobium sp. PP-F2F-G48 TaxID=2135651 RepID=UPI00104B733B|nr:site-specific integrase [Rhizobium sp. PP-F2F-G48]TCM55638.1 hypothetical protein C8J36_1032 [Rhizobium sp. PP-F2F-G48]
MNYSTSNFDLEFAPLGFKWGGTQVTGLPLISEPDGGLSEPLLAFFGYSVVSDRVAISSLRPEAFTLRQWLVFLYNKGLTLFDGTDELLIEFRNELGWSVEAEVGAKNESGKKRQSNEKFEKRKRISTKLGTIFTFYRDLPFALPFMYGGKRTPTFVGQNKDDRNHPITLKLGWDRKKKLHVQKWFYAVRVRVTPRTPRAVKPKESERLYSYLRGHAFRVQKKRRLAAAPIKDQIVADRNWLIAVAMVGGGLRCEEVSRLSVYQLAAALFDAGITSSLIDLDSIAEDKDAKKRIISKVLSLKDRKEYAFLSVRITGKGLKTRYVPFQIETVCDLLEVGVWGCRHQQMKLWNRADQDKLSPEILLSFQTKKALDSGTIGDIIAKGFKACKIPKSAHQLRGLFATVTAAAMWREYFSQNQYRFDQVLINMALTDLAAALGHSSINTTVRYYVDKELHANLTKIDSKSANLFRKIWDILVMGRRELSDVRTNILIQFVDRLSLSEDSSFFTLATSMMLNDPRLILDQTHHPSRPTLAYDAS